jgi:hypothetical protein
MNRPGAAFIPPKKSRQAPIRLSPGLLSILVILAFAAFFWWSRVQHTEAADRIAAGSNMDIYVYHLPVYEHGFRMLKAGRIPLWNPYTNCGMPFLATYQMALFYPLNVLHWFLRTELAFSLTYLMHFFLAGVFMYLWIRELDGTHVAAAFAATAYMLCSFVCYPLTWPHYILGQAWIPMVFFFVHRTFFRSRWTDAVLLGASLGCQFLAGYADGFVYTLYGAFAYLIFITLMKLVTHEREPSLFWRSLALTAVGLSIIPALLTAVQWMPTFQLWSLSARPPGGLTHEAILIGGSLYPSMFLAALINPDSFRWSQYTLYPGIVTLVMAAFAFTHWKRWRELVFLSVLAVVSTLIAFGTHTPVFKLYLSLPSGDWFRMPNRLLILTAFSVATLAGIGCSHLVEGVLAKPKPFSDASTRYGIFMAICAAFILLLPKSGGLYVFILLIGCLLGARGRSATMVGVLAVVLVGLDLTLYISDPVTYPWITRDVFPELTKEKRFLRENVGLDRVHIFHRKSDWKNLLFNLNFGLVERIRETSGYEPLSLQRYAEFCAYLDKGDPLYEPPFYGALHWEAGSANPDMLNILGARYIVDDVGRTLYTEKALPKSMPKGFKLKKVFSGTLNIYDNPAALPRAFYVTDAEVIREKHKVLDRLADRSFDPRNTVILEEEVRPPAAPADSSSGPSSPQVIVKAVIEGEINIVADVPAPGFIVLNDMFTPGWTARVDGKDSAIYQADYLLMAVPVGAGTHAIEFRYEPAGFRMGKWITLVTAGLLSLSLAFDVARRRAKGMAPWEKKVKGARPHPKQKRT